MTRNDYVDCENVYDTEKFYKKTTVDKYFKDYVNIPYFEKYCKECRNYNKGWECPPFNKNMKDYWMEFENIDIIAVKLNYTKEFREKTYTTYELNYIIKNTLYKERAELKKELIKLEEEKNGRYLYGGRCDNCKKCTKESGKPCKFPDKMRYSVESIGSNVGKVTKDFFNFELKWIDEDYKIPEYLTVLCGVLY